MEKKSESWGPWLVSGIKSLICPRKKHNLETIQKTPFQSIANFLNMRETMAISFANKSFNAKAENHRVNLMNLLDCVRASMIYEMGVRLLRSKANCTDYYDIRYKFNYKNRQIRIRAFTDFAKNFIMEKDEQKYHNLVAELPNMCQEINDWPNMGQAPDRSEFKNFMIEFIQAAGFKYEDIANGKYKSDLQRSNVKKQIQNYEQITSKSYESIYEHIKNNPDPEKPEREDYIKAYEELKKEGGGCNIF